jgi:transposase InsO family protein
MPPSKKDYNIVFIIINYFSKQAVFFPYYKTVTAKDIARFYINAIFRYKDSSDSIISDRSSQFVSNFWKEFCRILDIKLKFSTAYHLQKDGQTEIIN